MPLCNRLTRKESNQLYLEVLQANDIPAMRRLCREDLFFLLTVAFKRKDVNHPWLYDRCREVEANPNGFLDLWFREGYKSTLITYGKTIQDILASHGNNKLAIWDQELTVGIFSHTRPIAKGFLDQIKRELEENQFLINLFPDVLYKEPRREAPSWSLDGGLVVKRKSNPKEKTIEAWGLVDGAPVSKHFSLLVYDDVVTRESVTTPEQIKKTTEAWALSLNLGTREGKRRYIGTRYHFNDTYKTIIERGAAIPRVYSATHDGTLEGQSVFLSKELLAEKRKEMGQYVFSSQMLQNPVADSVMCFKQDWLRFYDQLRNYQKWNFYITVDPAGEKKRNSDYTVLAVIALAPDNNYYLVDGIRDRLNLTERTTKLFDFVKKYRPLNVGYEKYGLQSDIEHIKYEMEIRNYRFKITALKGQVSKEDRIRKLVPVFEQGRFYLPYRLIFVDREGKVRDFIKEFIEDEYLAFPVAVHDDMLDCLSRIVDPDLQARFPLIQNIREPSITMVQNVNRVQTEYSLFG